MEPTSHLKTIAFILIFGFYHFAVTSTSRSCGQKPYTVGWQPSEKRKLRVKMKVRVLSLLPVCLYSFLYFCWRVLYSVLDKESVDSKVLVPSNKFRCKTSLLTAVRTRREQYNYTCVTFDNSDALANLDNLSNLSLLSILTILTLLTMCKSTLLKQS